MCDCGRSQLQNKFGKRTCDLMCFLLHLYTMFSFTGISQWQVPSIGNGYCDQDNNKPECNYDGGDCCECTCEISGFDDDYFGGRWAGCNEFACIDPEAPCVDDDSITVEMLDKCDYVSRAGMGRPLGVLRKTYLRDDRYLMHNLAGDRCAGRLFRSHCLFA